MNRTQTAGVICTALLAVSLAGSTASAIPDPRLCSFDAVGVGGNSGTPIGGTPAGFDITLLELGGIPIQTGWAGLGFAGTGVRVYSVQNAGVTVDAVNQTVTARFTSGHAHFALRTGGSSNTSAVEVIGDGVVLGLTKWRSTDIDGLGGTTGLEDMTYASNRFLARVAAPECNFDLSTSDVPDLADLTIVASEYLSGASGTYAW